jgi:ATP-dependent DNA helicase HFM1/MER3
LQKPALKLKREFEFSDDEDMEVIDLAQDYSTASYSDFAPRDYRKLPNLHSNVQENKMIRLVGQKPQYQYGSGNPPQLPFAPNGTDGDYFSDGMDFPSPSVLARGSKNRKSTSTPPCGVTKDNNYASVGCSSQLGAPLTGEAGDPSEEGTVAFPEQPPESSLGNASLDSLEAGMLELEDPMTRSAPAATSPKLNSSFVDGIFDFEAFHNEDDSQGSHLSLSAYQPAGLHTPAEKHTRQAMKRVRSPNPNEEFMKCRRIAKDDNVIRPLQAGQSPPKPVYPEWLNEFDTDLIDGFKDVVDFID